MKASRKLTRALFLLAIGAGLGLAAVSQVGKVMAEDGANGEVMATQAALHSDDRDCERREVETDEGYGLSRKETRLVCH
jgi:hypothetical protein